MVNLISTISIISLSLSSSVVEHLIRKQNRGSTPPINMQKNQGVVGSNPA